MNVSAGVSSLNGYFTLTAAAYLLASSISASAAAQPVTSVINYESSADGTQQPALWYAAPRHLGSRPLLVGLHFWESGYDSGGHVEFEKWCVFNGWHFIYPHFRGPNVGPEATGSLLAIQDIVDAVKYARNEADVDNSRIYLAGASGGGHMALMMVGVHPEIGPAHQPGCRSQTSPHGTPKGEGTIRRCPPMRGRSKPPAAAIRRSTRQPQPSARGDRQ